MTLREETRSFLDDLQKSAGRMFIHRNAVGALLDQARARGMEQVFDDLIFVAKFLAKTFDLLRRIGPDGDGYDRITAEFQTNLEKATTLAKTLVKESDQELKDEMSRLFFRMDQESMSAFMELCRELAWVKNWTLDGKPLP